MENSDSEMESDQNNKQHDPGGGGVDENGAHMVDEGEENKKRKLSLEGHAANINASKPRVDDGNDPNTAGIHARTHAVNLIN